jgi:Carboxypeptidase regulatory-like domain/TonB-dependent Receptor Plug Domain
MKTAQRYTRTYLWLVICVILMFSVSLVAQSYRGSIRGTVRDASGAVVPGASISAKNLATGETRTAASGPDGGYVVAEVPAGQYEVSASSASLATVTSRVLVAVGADTTADFDLAKVRTAKEQLTVTAAAPVVDTTRDVLGQVVDQTLVGQLPLNGRDFGKLVALVPGVTVEPAGVAGSQAGFGQFNINGNRDRSNNYTLDGTDNNDPFFNNSALNQVGITGAPASLLPIDAIQEFNLQSNFSAEYGRNSGSVVNIITKSGTNAVHGTVFEYLRNSVFDARNYFNVRTNPDGSANPHSPFKNNQFGGSLGGPLIKNRTFFFGAYEGQRERVGSDFLLFVPTAAQKSAARSVALANGLAAINPALDKVLDFFPAATGFNGSAGTAAISAQDRNDLDNFILKIDHQLTTRQSLTGRYAFARSDQTFPLGAIGGFGSGSRLPQFAQTSPTRVQVVSLSLLSTLSANRINEVRFGYSRYRTSFNAVDATFDPASIGLNLGTGKTGLPEFDFSGSFDNLGASAFSIPRGRVSQSYQFLDNFTVVSGRNTWKFGGEFRRYAIDNFNDNLERGLFDVFGTGLASDPSIDVLANFYLGSNVFVSANTGNTQRTTYNNGLAFFAQDDFRASPTFTLNLGLRWEYFGPLSEKHNLLSNLASDGTLAMVGTHGMDGAYNRDLNNFGPRLGFAWSVRPKTVLRAAYGIYYDYIPQDLLIANFTTSAGLVTNPVGSVPVLPLNFNPSAYNGSAAGPILGGSSPPFSVLVTPRNFATPYVQNFNLNIQQQLAENSAFQISYVGSKGTRLTRLLDANQPDINGVRPNPNFSFEDVLATVSSSTYHSLQTSFRSQNWHGFSGFASYIFSKSLDDASDGIDFNFATAALPQNSLDLHAEHGPSTFDTRHRFTAALDYAVPKLSWLPGKLSQGWTLNSIVSVQSGRPIPIITSTDTSALPTAFSTPSNFHQRPNLLPGVNPILSKWTPATGYLNPLAFQQPADGSFGNLGRDAIFGPGYWDLDFSLAKSTQIYERLNLQFRAEFFNIFNHPNFALPNGSITPGLNADGSLSNGGPIGVITQTPDVAQGNPGLGGGGPRVIQFGLRLSF